MFGLVARPCGKAAELATSESMPTAMWRIIPEPQQRSDYDSSTMNSSSGCSVPWRRCARARARARLRLLRSRASSACMPPLRVGIVESYMY
eukprot:COSAG02_NODE_8346_length_2604_cov_3.055489_3_plen_91_part_00